MSRNPFDEIERMFDRMSRQFERFDEDLLEGSIPVDVADTGDEFVVTADLPGFDADEINVEYTGDSLTISATHTDEEADDAETDEFRYIRRERRYRSLSRTIRLPEPIDSDDAEATHRNGVLSVQLPKDRGDDSRNIPIS